MWVEVIGKENSTNTEAYSPGLTSSWESEALKEKGVGPDTWPGGPSHFAQEWWGWIVSMEGLIWQAEWDTDRWKWGTDDQEEIFLSSKE